MTTIFAVSSGQPPAAIAVLRISGPDAFAVATRMAGSVPLPRRAALRAIVDPADGTLLDRALVLAFPASGSATGEDLIELHLHGGRAVVAAVAAVLARQPGLVPAEPGGFTRRAMANGRIDLTEAEGLGDLLAAETEGQRRAALRRAEGGVRRQAEAWTDAVLALAARVEAQLDHADEDDVGVDEAIGADCAALAEVLRRETATPPVERLRDGIRVVLAGPPNAGKSTLLNALAQREVAIVSPIAGTTRDRVEASVVRAGMAWLLTDTAGLAANTIDPVERIGIARAQEAAATADILLWLGDGPAPDHPVVLPIHARTDLPGRSPAPAGAIAVSAQTGAGIDALWQALSKAAAALIPREDMVVLNRREQELLVNAAAHLEDAAAQRDLLLVAEQLRLARLTLDRITGRADVEGVLDALFGRFCIGK